MKMEAYTKKVAKDLLCEPSRKKEIVLQMESDIAGAMEEGRALEEVLAELGEPEDVAKEFNDNFSETEKKEESRRRRRKKRRIVIAVVAVAVLLLAVLIYWAVPKTKDIADSRIFDREEVLSEAEYVIALLDEEDYETMEDGMTEQLAGLLAGGELDKAKDMVSEEFGAFLKYTYEEAVEVTQQGQKFAVVQMSASYENVSVVYTLSFDEEMRLAGIYMR